MTRPTARGASVLVVAAATYLAARIVGTWELYLLAFALLAAVVVTWVQVRAIGRRLQVTRAVTPRQPVAGDPLLLSFRVKSESLVPGQQVTLLHADGSLGGPDRPLHVESLGSRGERVVKSGPWPARRGVHHLPALVAVAEDPLGFVEVRRSMSTLDVVVPPRLVHLGSCALFADRGVGGSSHRLPTLRGSEFRGIRPHNPGEPLNRVDWKATAKTGSLMLRETEDAGDGGVTLLLNGAEPHVTGEPPETNFELAIQAAGSIADYALRAGHATTLLLPEQHWRPLRLAPDAKGHVRLLEVLAGAAPRGLPQLGGSLCALISGGRLLERTRMLLLVVLALDGGLVRELIALQRVGLRASVVHVAAGSFGSAASAGESSNLRLALSAAGVGYLSLGRGDDLRAALSIPGENRRARVR
jgi:uncharacterized protein (DUF58 family)